MAVIPKKYLKLHPVQNYQDLSDHSQAVRLTRDLKRIVDAVNLTMDVDASPMPTGLTISQTGGVGTLAWDDVQDTFRTHLDGARIWRADGSVDAELVFEKNNAKQIVVSCSRTTKYPDLEVIDSGEFIYWVQWINRDGNISPAAGGVTISLTTL